MKKFVDDLAVKAIEESQYLPVDRGFLKPYLPLILLYDNKEFIFENIKLENDLYVNQLFLCLPDLWSKINSDAIIDLASKIESEIQYYILLKFTYKYLEIDLLSEFLSDIKKNRPTTFLRYILQVLENQYGEFVKTQYEINEYNEDKYWGIDLEEWKSIKKRILSESNAKSAMTDEGHLKEYFNNLVSVYR